MITIITSIGFLIVKYVSQESKQADKITGQDIYNDLDLGKVDKISIHSFKYIENGEIKGDKDYLIENDKDKKVINMLTSAIKNSQINIKENSTQNLPKATHSVVFYSNNMFNNISTNYSLQTNQLLISDKNFSEDLIESSKLPFSTQVVIIKLDDDFKEIMNNYP